MSLQIALGPYRATVVNDLSPLRAPNPACCSDPSVLCGNCAALVLRQAGYGATCNEEQDDDNEDDLDWEKVDDEEVDDEEDDPDDTSDRQERLDNLYPDIFEESAMTRNVDKSKLTYVGLPGEMAAGQTLTANRQPLTCNACPENGKPSSPLCANCGCKDKPTQNVKRSPAGVMLTPMGCPGEEGKR